MTNSTTFPGTVTATTFAGSGASLTSIPAGQIIGSFSGNTAFDTTTLVVDGTNNRVGAGTTTPQKTLEVAGPMRITDGLSNVCDLSIGLVQATSGFDTGTEIVPPSHQAGDNFSKCALSADGTRMIVGSPGIRKAHIFAYNNGSWSHEVTFTEGRTSYGRDVGISADGTKVIIGQNGYAYIKVYNGSAWVNAGNGYIGSNNYGFGHSVAISGDGTKVLVGIWQADIGTTDTGSAELFTVNVNGYYTSTQTFYASDRQSYDYYGALSCSLDFLGNTAVIGAFAEDTGGSAAGAAYVHSYDGSSWGGTSRHVKLQASDAQANDEFGRTVKINDDGTKIIVGAYGEDTGQTAAGAAYIFTGSEQSWSQQQKLQAPVPQIYAYFGLGLAINGAGTRVCVSAYGEDSVANAGDNIGKMYIYDLSGTTWSHTATLAHPDPTSGDYLGERVAMSSDGKTIAAGAVYRDTGGTSSGSVYVYAPPSASGLTSSTPISADGTTLSFTGQHMCVPQGPMSPGLVVSANKNRYVSLNGALTTGMGAIRSSESLPVVSLSNVVSDRSVFGVVDRLEQGGTTERRQVVGATVVTAQKELGDNRVIVNSLGEGAIWVADTNGPLVSGDYITTSHLTGYGQKQDDDILHNSTVAKITMDCDFNPDDVPIQVIKKNDTGDNDLDPYGHIQWEDHPSKTAQKAYTIRYLTVDGNGTDEANAVHRTAFVGCTYHCG
jgi:hypothetical protein